ncbi:MAG: Gfo/Idh/MocA family oxidoreductase [Bacteroidales bacterium]|nr:Gfo/Idh/MocA family oxidoreductase [Bacteroidales bacterium]
MKVGIIGAGHIGGKIARTLAQTEGIDCLAVGSRSLEKAEGFAREFCIPRAYGSYSDLLDDPDVDLVYVATPHSHHFDVTMEAISKGKPCLVEKAFMANAEQTRQVLNLSKEKNVFVAEAIWTRYQPAAEIIRRLVSYGKVGRLRLISATLAYSIENKPRVMRPDLCGGALLDLGVYALNFVRMVCSNPIEKIGSECILSDGGVDLTESISLTLSGGIMANIQSSAACAGYNTAVVAGSEGYLVIDNVNNPKRIGVYAKGGIFVEEITVPPCISGYEYEFLACRDSIAQGLIQPPQMPHDEILFIMELMDSLRKEWGVRYPMDGQDS